MNTFESNDEYLEHLFGLGYRKERKNHKYIKKINTPKGPRYFYTQADLKAYYARQKIKDAAVDVWDGSASMRKQREAAAKLDDSLRNAFTKYSMDDIRKAKNDYIDATVKARRARNNSIKGILENTTFFGKSVLKKPVLEIKIPKFGLAKSVINKYKDVPVIMLPNNPYDIWALDKAHNDYGYSYFTDEYQKVGK